MEGERKGQQVKGKEEWEGERGREEGMNEEREGQSKKGKITRGLQITKQIHMQMQSHTVKVYIIIIYICMMVHKQ